MIGVSCLFSTQNGVVFAFYGVFTRECNSIFYFPVGTDLQRLSTLYCTCGENQQKCVPKHSPKLKGFDPMSHSSHLCVVLIVIETGQSLSLSSSATSQGIPQQTDTSPMVCN